MPQRPSRDILILQSNPLSDQVICSAKRVFPPTLLMRFPSVYGQ
jgi:hypothetical protein